jgi:hypothetical protein
MIGGKPETCVLACQIVRTLRESSVCAITDHVEYFTLIYSDIK